MNIKTFSCALCSQSLRRSLESRGAAFRLTEPAARRGASPALWLPAVSRAWSSRRPGSAAFLDR